MGESSKRRYRASASLSTVSLIAHLSCFYQRIRSPRAWAQRAWLLQRGGVQYAGQCQSWEGGMIACEWRGNPILAFPSRLGKGSERLFPSGPRRGPIERVVLCRRLLWFDRVLVSLPNGSRRTGWSPSTLIGRYGAGQCQSWEGGMATSVRMARRSVAMMFVVPSHLETRPVTSITWLPSSLRRLAKRSRQTMT